MSENWKASQCLQCGKLILEEPGDRGEPILCDCDGQCTQKVPLPQAWPPLWISIVEGMPESHDVYLIFVVDPHRGAGWADLSYWDGTWTADWDILGGDVTHWMPTPRPPGGYYD